MDTENPLISHHIFLFPFKWDFLPAGKSILETSFSERTPIEKIERVIKGLPWGASPFKIALNEADQFHTFNEFNYFHDYARDALALNLNEQKTTLRFRYRLPKDEAIYKITIENGDKASSTTYQLVIRDILLTWYDVGIGFLAFFLENRETDNPDDILRINDFGRRIYPQFLGFVPESPEQDSQDKATDAPMGSFLAKSICLIGLKKEPIEETFSYYNNVSCLNGEPFQLPNHIGDLLGPEFSVGTRETKRRRTENSILLSPVIDDRMYLLCYYFPTEGLNSLRKYDAEKRQYSYIQDKFWYAYLFVDSSQESTCHSRPMRERLVKRHTYDRWLEYQRNNEPEGQIFGISRYSFMMLADRSWFTENIILNHHRYLYFQMMTLSFMQRAAVLRFAAEAADISEIINTEGDVTRQKKLIREVYRAYLNFTNKVYFREITPQEQGIELYDMVREIMEIDTDMQALQREIEELHRYALLMEGEKSSRQAGLLTVVATIFLPPTLVAAFFGFSNFPTDYPYWKSLVIAVAFSAALITFIFGLIWLIPMMRKR